MPNPDDEPEASKKVRRATHRRQKKRDTITKVVRVKRATESAVNPPPHLGYWPAAANDPPALPDPPLQRRIPPPAPLPSEPPADESFPPPPDETQRRKRRVEEAIGVTGLAVLVTAMVVAMWLRMTGG